MPAANNVTRMLDARGVQHEVFELPPAKLGALEAAALMRTAPELVFKTIVVLSEPPGKPLLVLVPWDFRRGSEESGDGHRRKEGPASD